MFLDSVIIVTCCFGPLLQHGARMVGQRWHEEHHHVMESWTRTWAAHYLVHNLVLKIKLKGEGKRFMKSPVTRWQHWSSFNESGDLMQNAGASNIRKRIRWFVQINK